MCSEMLNMVVLWQRCELKLYTTSKRPSGSCPFPADIHNDLYSLSGPKISAITVSFDAYSSSFYARSTYSPLHFPPDFMLEDCDFSQSNNCHSSKSSHKPSKRPFSPSFNSSSTNSHTILLHPSCLVCGIGVHSQIRFMNFAPTIPSFGSGFS